MRENLPLGDICFVVHVSLVNSHLDYWIFIEFAKHALHSRNNPPITLILIP